MERYFLEPYRFIPPFRGTFWLRLMRRMIPRHLRKKMGVTRWHFEGIDRLRASLDRQAGIVLTPNHSRLSDPMVLGLLAWQTRQYLYYLASHHLFRQNRLMGWVLNRLGGYSIFREGSDREAIKASARILADAERPVVLFPEGTWFRQNDRVGPLQDGLTLITRQAARQGKRPLVIHPVGIKYWMLADPRPEVDRRLTRLERRLSWHPQAQLDLLARLEKLGGALLALKEVEFLGEPGTGELDQRISRLTESQVGRLERLHLGRTHDGWPLERIRRLRQHLSRRLVESRGDAAATAAVRRDLSDLLFCENLAAQSLGYLRDDPSPERLGETLQRIEETIDDSDMPVTAMGVTVVVGEPIDARPLGEDRRNGDAQMQPLREAIQALVDQLRRQGPPPEWGCPPRLGVKYTVRADGRS